MCPVPDPTPDLNAIHSRVLQHADKLFEALEDLAKLKISIAKTKFFVIASGHNPAALQIDTVRLPKHFAPQPQQLALFEAVTGEL